MRNKKPSFFLCRFLKEAYPNIGNSLINDASILPVQTSMTPENDHNERMIMKKRSQLEFSVLRDRRIRFGGKTLQGVTLPKRTTSQVSIIKRLLTRYGPCLETQEAGYLLNKDCFDKREAEFLKRLAKHLSNLRFKYIL